MTDALVPFFRWENRDLKGLSDLMSAFSIPSWVCCLDLVLPGSPNPWPGGCCVSQTFYNGLSTFISQVLMPLLPTTPAWARHSLSGEAAARESEVRHHDELFDATMGMTLVLRKKELAL